MDMHKCLDCEQEVKHNKAISGITIDIKLEGYDKLKQQLRNLEATFDRIIEKQKQIYNADEWKSTLAEGRWVKAHQLLERIDTDCGRIVRKLGCDKIQTNTMKASIDGVKREIHIYDDIDKGVKIVEGVDFDRLKIEEQKFWDKYRR